MKGYQELPAPIAAFFFEQ